jgi:hypothetical protein
VKNGNEWHLVCDVFRTVRRNTVNYQYTVKQKELVLLTSGAPKPFTGKLYFPSTNLCLTEIRLTWHNGLEHRLQLSKWMATNRA